MSGQIYLIQHDTQLVELRETPYASEDKLQELLAKYPNLLAGEQIDSARPRRWLLVSREMSVPGEEDGGGRWSLDHLFLDQDAVPTLVEVKRSSDTRLRREAVGQMLDYAANAVVHWPLEQIRATFEAQCERDGAEAEERILELLGDDGDENDFWQQVKRNLQAGRIRMVIVADAVPNELRRIVEFLNGQMDPAEVLAVEVKQYVGESVKTLVPRVLGQTATAQQKKESSRPARTDIATDDFLQRFANHQSQNLPTVRQLIQWAQQQEVELKSSIGARGAFLDFAIARGERSWTMFRLKPDGEISFQMRRLYGKAPFDREQVRADLQRKLETVPGFHLRDAGMQGFPYLVLSELRTDVDLKHLFDGLHWMLEQIRACADTPPDRTA